MSHENVELVRRLTDVMDRESFEAALPVFAELAHTDVVWREDPGWPGADTYRGLDEVRRTIFDRLESLDFEHVLGGAITKVEFYLDRAEALEAVGLRE